MSGTAGHSTTAPVLSLRDVAYRYPGAPRDSLQVEDLDLEPGSLTVVLGAAGSGLSTLCLVLSGLAPRVVGGELRGHAARSTARTSATGPCTVSARPSRWGCRTPEVSSRSWPRPSTRRWPSGRPTWACRAARSWSAPTRRWRSWPSRASPAATRDTSLAASSGSSGSPACWPCALAASSWTSALANLDASGRECLAAALQVVRADGAAVVLASHRTDALGLEGALALVMAAGRIERRGPAPATAGGTGHLGPGHRGARGAAPGQTDASGARRRRGPVGGAGASVSAGLTPCPAPGSRRREPGHRAGGRDLRLPWRAARHRRPQPRHPRGTGRRPGRRQRVWQDDPGAPPGRAPATDAGTLPAGGTGHRRPACRAAGPDGRAGLPGSRPPGLRSERARRGRVRTTTAGLPQGPAGGGRVDGARGLWPAEVRARCIPRTSGGRSQAAGHRLAAGHGHAGAGARRAHRGARRAPA